MKIKTQFFNGFFGIIVAGFLCMGMTVYAQETFKQFKGTILDSNTKEELVFVNVSVKDTNISTVSNTEGEFTLKVPSANANGTLVASLLGYQQSEIALSLLSAGNTEILLSPKVIQLSEVNVTNFESAGALVRKVFKDKYDNSPKDAVLMTAFYRETIKRRNRNVSLTEAVVDLYKQPYSRAQRDILVIHKARKSTDYRRLDTVAVKMQGGPFSTLYLDIMKYPEYIFNDNSIDFYDFSFDQPSSVNDKPVYVVRFKQKESVIGSGYIGKLFIDVETLALTSATYSLNITDTKEASELFVRKKPGNVKVEPLKAIYRVDYREHNGKWHYGYGSVQVSFKISKKRKWFSQIYSLSSEMAVTDWKVNTSGFMAKPKDRLKPTVIIADAVSGFSDPDFWGPFNVIEPEKSIESAINKIRRKIKRDRG